MKKKSAPSSYSKGQVPFYPLGKNFSKSFIYLNNLQLNKTSPYFEVFNLANRELDATNITSKKNFQESLKALKILIEHEKKAEESFLTKIFLEKNKEIKLNNWSDLIKAINFALGNKAIFERNVNVIKKHTFKYVDVSKEISDYLYEQMLDERFWYQIMEVGMSEQDWLKIIKSSFESLYSEKYKDNVNRNIEAYQEVFKLINELNEDSPFFKEMLKLIKETDLYDLLLDSSFKNQSIQIKQAGQKSGKILEHLEKIILSAFFSEKDGNLVINTGGTQMKPDTAVFQNISKNGGLIPIADLETIVTDHFLATPQNEGEKEQSVRLRNIQRTENLFTQLSGASGNLIFISDKNYDVLSSDYKFSGFGAESPKFTNLRKILEKAGESDKVLDNLIFLLINVGEKLIGENKPEVQQKIYDYLAVKVAYFLFDDVVIDTKNFNISNLNIIHIFNLNNIYIPFSILLEGFYNSFAIIKDDYKNFIDIKISSYSPPDDDENFDGKINNGKIVSQADWIAAGNKAINNGELSIHFFKNFAQFIIDNIKI